MNNIRLGQDGQFVWPEIVGIEEGSTPIIVTVTWIDKDGSLQAIPISSVKGVTVDARVNDVVVGVLSYKYRNRTGWRGEYTCMEESND
jgi:hypothetical protein